MSSAIVHGDRIGHWVAERIGSRYRDDAVAIGLVRAGCIVAGIIYEDWTGPSIVCHIAIDGRLTPEFLHVISRYPFIQCGVQTIIAPADSSNWKSVMMLRKMGFSEEGRIRDAYPGGDLVLFTMSKPQCKYLQERYGKKCKTAASA